MIMRQTFIVLSILLAVSTVSFAMPSVGTVNVYFSPKGGATEAIVREIGNAKKEVLVQAHSFTSEPITKAILEARKRGIGVVALLDKNQRKERHTEADFLAKAGCFVLIDGSHAVHNKVIIVDRSTLITGSFDFEKESEEKNAEDMLLIKGNMELTEKYFANFDKHKRHSQRYSR
jgi:phosphatidylserine/phosphatidylglycerophosphate/cardiolipin synthase-like enzyme